MSAAHSQQPCKRRQRQELGVHDKGNVPCNTLYNVRQSPVLETTPRKVRTKAKEALDGGQEAILKKATTPSMMYSLRGHGEGIPCQHHRHECAWRDVLGGCAQAPGS